MTGSYLIGALNLMFTAIITFYFFNQLKAQQANKTSIEKESRKEIDKLKRLREISLTEPLSEKSRPAQLSEVIGQDRGIKALRAALCSANPQHVIVYGPPGVGKTAAARLVLEEAKRTLQSPFGKNAKFVEIDATTVRFDERSIADPLIGSVHDPIYQGAGSYGAAGIPQPKPGAVTKAHGGMLFLDEIGELHSIQMNKLLKVLEDRKVFLESAYYNSEDPNLPIHIKDVFENGLPADFRLVGATTRSPEELPAAIRSRCVEVFFRALSLPEIAKIAAGAAAKGGFELTTEDACEISRYSMSGRDAVNIVQTTGGLALLEGRHRITSEDISWVVESGNYCLRPEKKIEAEPRVGYVNGLAVFGANLGIVIEVEAAARAAVSKPGSITVTGIVDEEETGSYGHKLRRRSTSRCSIDNVLTVIRSCLGLEPQEYELHVNFPGGMPIDGPSAGITVATAIYSAIVGIPVSNVVAMTGELSIRGAVKPIGGINAKLEAAARAGARKVIIPRGNWQESFRSLEIEVIPVDRIEEVMKEALVKCPLISTVGQSNLPQSYTILSAGGSIECEKNR